MKLMLAISVLLAGCASAPESFSSCQQVRKDRILEERRAYGYSCAANPSCFLAEPRQVGTC